MLRIIQLLHPRGRIPETHHNEPPPLGTQLVLIPWCKILTAATTTNTDRLHFNYFSFELHHKPPKIGVIIAILQMRKRRLREVGASPKCIPPIRGSAN